MASKRERKTLRTPPVEPLAYEHRSRMSLRTSAGQLIAAIFKPTGQNERDQNSPTSAASVEGLLRAGVRAPVATFSRSTSATVRKRSTDANHESCRRGPNAPHKSAHGPSIMLPYVSANMWVRMIHVALALRPPPSGAHHGPRHEMLRAKLKAHFLGDIDQPPNQLGE